MTGAFKSYNPPTYTCPQCGTPFICRNPTDYAFRKYSSGKRKLMMFCKESCMRKYQQEHPVKEYRRMK